MYSRTYQGRTLRFEPSGGLMHSALVMQDKETDSYWSIMTGNAIAGPLKGTPLEELPVGVKMRWKDWVELHPDTLVLSVGGREEVERNPYQDYFESDRGFGGMVTPDRRLETKTPIYAFRFEGKKYAAPFRKFEGGRVFKLGSGRLFLYRPRKAPVFESSVAYWTDSGTFQKEDGEWLHTPSGRKFDPEARRFMGPESSDLRRLEGFDTYWYTWSLTHPDTRIL